MGADNSKRSWHLAVVLGVNAIKHSWKLHGGWKKRSFDSGRGGHCWKQQIMWLHKSRKRIPSPNRFKQTHKAKKKKEKKPQETQEDFIPCMEPQRALEPNTQTGSPNN